MFELNDTETVYKKIDVLSEKISALGKRFNKELEKENKENVNNELISIKEFAKRTSFSRFIIKQDIEKGFLKTVTKGSKKYLWSSDISDYIK